MRAAQALVVASCVLFAGCECGETNDRSTPLGTGAEEREDPARGIAIRMRDPGSGIALPERFEPVAAASATGSTRARGWASLDDLERGRGAARMSLGNWLCRLWTHYGPPPEVQRDGYVYAFRDRESGAVITAYSAGSGPAMGGLIADGNEAEVAASVDAFVAMIEATEPRACELDLDTDLGRIRVGVRDGEWFEDELE